MRLIGCSQLRITLGFTFALLTTGLYAAEPIPFSARIAEPEVQAFIDTVAEKHNIPRSWIEQQLAHARLLHAPVRQMNKPSEAKPWHIYRGLHVKPAVIGWGADFAAEHSETLARAESEFGVPQRIILGILGVETRYGRYQGATSILDSLTTFAFNYPRRERFFRIQLEEFLLHNWEQKTDPRAALGSYAGAVGMAQFMPDNVRRLAVDYDGDGVRDLANSPADAIGSIGNFLKAKGWTAQQPVLQPLAQVERRPEPARYTVQAGDSLWKIAQQLRPAQASVATTVQALIEQNPHAFMNNDPNRLQVGVTLTLREAQTPLDLEKCARLKPCTTMDAVLAHGLEHKGQMGPFADQTHTLPSNTAVLPVILDGAEGPEYLLGFDNFHALSRYNPRTHYVMAVLALGDAVIEEIARRNTDAPTNQNTSNLNTAN
jgi:lytic murein transglycosylase B